MTAMHFLLAIYVRAHYYWLAKDLQTFVYIKHDNNMIVIYPELVLITLFKLRKTSLSGKSNILCCTFISILEWQQMNKFF